MSILKLNKKVIFIGFLFVAGFTAIILFQHLHSKTVEAQNQATLTLQVSASQNRYLQLEPIPFNFKLSNQTTIPIKWDGMIIDGTLVFDKNVNFLVRGDDNNIIRHTGIDHSIDMITAGEVSLIGKNKEVKNLLSGNLLESLFPQPGSYQLQFEFTYRDFTYGQRRDVTILSNPVMIEITEPRGRNKLAYDYLKNVYEPVNRRGKVNDKIQVRQHFVDNFNDSVYGKYLTFNLASSYMMSKKLF